MTRLAIIGNCQAQMLEGMFSQFATNVHVDRLAPNFQMTSADAPAVRTTLAQADIIFAQRVSKSYHLSWLTPAGLRAAYGDRVTIWPNLYFDGYTPGVHYIYLQGWGKLCSPLTDYHLREVVDAHRAGADANQAVQTLQHAPAPAADSFDASLAELRAREAEVDVPISDFLAPIVKRQRCFYTPNHPKNLLLAEMGSRLATAAGIAFDALAAAASFPSRLDAIYIPAAPAVVRRHNLPFDHFPLYRGVEVGNVSVGQVALGKPRCFELQPLVDSFYRIYDVAFRAD
jgi:hypothetical protein